MREALELADYDGDGFDELLVGEDQERCEEVLPRLVEQVVTPLEGGALRALSRRGISLTGRQRRQLSVQALEDGGQTRGGTLPGLLGADRGHDRRPRRTP